MEVFTQISSNTKGFACKFKCASASRVNGPKILRSNKLNSKCEFRQCHTNKFANSPVLCCISGVWLWTSCSDKALFFLKKVLASLRTAKPTNCVMARGLHHTRISQVRANDGHFTPLIREHQAAMTYSSRYSRHEVFTFHCRGVQSCDSTLCQSCSFFLLNLGDKSDIEYWYLKFWLWIWPRLKITLSVGVAWQKPKNRKHTKDHCDYQVRSHQKRPFGKQEVKRNARGSKIIYTFSHWNHWAKQCNVGFISCLGHRAFCPCRCSVPFCSIFCAFLPILLLSAHSCALPQLQIRLFPFVLNQWQK